MSLQTAALCIIPAPLTLQQKFSHPPLLPALHNPAFTIRVLCPPRKLAVRSSLRDAEELVRLKVIRTVPASDASNLLAKDGYKLLDVRPVWEREKAFVTGSYHVPLFVEDEDTGYMTLFRKSIQQGYGGVWMGQRLTTRNELFLDQVRSLIPNKGEKVIVACGEGLRSLLALDALHDDGYSNLAWIDGGFAKSREGNFLNVEGSSKLQFASIGGAAEYLLKAILFTQSVVSSVMASKVAADKSR